MLSLPAEAHLELLFLGDRLQLKTVSTKGMLGVGVIMPWYQGNSSPGALVLSEVQQDLKSEAVLQYLGLLP